MFCIDNAKKHLKAYVLMKLQYFLILKLFLSLRDFESILINKNKNSNLQIF